MTDVTSLIQRVPELESRAGITLEGVYASIEEPEWDQKTLEVNFDVVAPSGSIRKSIAIYVSAYNRAGELVGTESTTIWDEDFVGMESVSERVTLYDNPSAILVFPRNR